MVILFIEHGRLGNQLFQYCGLRQFFPEDKLVFWGCEDLQKNFDFVDARFFPKSALGRWIPFEILKRIVFFLVATRVFGQITEDKESVVFNLAVRRGLFWNIYVPQNVFCQHRNVVDQIKKTPYLKNNLAEAALNYFREKEIDLNSCSPVFVHFRRGDYLHWPSRESPAVLSLDWYKRAMESVQQKIRNPVFVLMSDDQFYLRDIFEEAERLVISNNSAEVDLAIMSLCHSGILSASSFAWWGAFYASSKDKQGATFWAPMYWAGHRSKKWIPAGFRTDSITYIE